MPNADLSDLLATLDRIADDVIAPAAVQVDAEGQFPQVSVDALREAGLLGLLSATEVGGMGKGHREAALVVERVARACGSTAMVLCMHYCGTAVLEKYGPVDVRTDAASGKLLSTLAFSEA